MCVGVGVVDGWRVYIHSATNIVQVLISLFLLTPLILFFMIPIVLFCITMVFNEAHPS